MRDKEAVELAVKWFMGATPAQQERAVYQLFLHAIMTEWVGVWDPKDRQELAEESGMLVDHYAAPYFRTCGDPIDAGEAHG